MRVPLDIREMELILQRSPKTPMVIAIWEALHGTEHDLVPFSRELSAPEGTLDALIVKAFEHYAMHESGRLVTGGARIFHRSRFRRCYNKIIYPF